MMLKYVKYVNIIGEGVFKFRANASAIEYAMITNSRGRGAHQRHWLG